MDFLKDDDYFLVLDHISPRKLTLEELKRVRQTGAKVLIYHTNWKFLEPEMGKYDWVDMDNAIKMAEEADFKVLLGDFSVGADCLPKEWYVASNPRLEEPDRRWGALSIWNKDAMDYVENFIRVLGNRYGNDRVNIMNQQPIAAETYLPFEPENVYFDDAAIQSYREFVGDYSVIPDKWKLTSCTEPTRTWIKNSIINFVTRRNQVLMEVNNNKEIWHSTHWCWATMGQGGGAMFIRDVLDHQKAVTPDIKIHGIQYTYWCHGEGYKKLVREDAKKYNIDFYVGAEYCEGLPVYMPQMLKEKYKGFIIAPLSPLTNHERMEDWMFVNMKNAYDTLSRR